MAEYKLFEGDTAPFTDSEFYRDREAAHHLEQGGHTERLVLAGEYVKYAFDQMSLDQYATPTVSDLGCGDGGLLQHLRDTYGIIGWGYDMQPSNVNHAQNTRKVDVRLTDFGASNVQYGDIVVMTEVLEHLSDPHGTLRSIPDSTTYLIASSPFHETRDAHYEFHNWAWDDEGYDALLEQAGFTVVKHEHVWLNQVLLGVR